MNVCASVRLHVESQKALNNKMLTCRRTSSIGTLNDLYAWLQSIFDDDMFNMPLVWTAGKGGFGFAVFAI